MKWSEIVLGTVAMYQSYPPENSISTSAKYLAWNVLIGKRLFRYTLTSAPFLFFILFPWTDTYTIHATWNVYIQETFLCNEKPKTRSRSRIKHGKIEIRMIFPITFTNESKAAFHIHLASTHKKIFYENVYFSYYKINYKKQKRYIITFKWIHFVHFGWLVS